MRVKVVFTLTGKGVYTLNGIEAVIPLSGKGVFTLNGIAVVTIGRGIGRGIVCAPPLSP